MPRANTGNGLLDFISDAGLALLQMERRIDPWLRPAFDALLRDRLAQWTTALINKQRKDEGFQIAEERLMPDEEAWTESIVASFKQQLNDL